MSGFTPTPSHPSGLGRFRDSIAKPLPDARTRSEPKDITEEEYLDFYRSTFKDYRKPISWHHFAGDAAGTSFKGIIFLPEKMFVFPILSLRLTLTCCTARIPTGNRPVHWNRKISDSWSNTFLSLPNSVPTDSPSGPVGFELSSTLTTSLSTSLVRLCNPPSSSNR